MSPRASRLRSRRQFAIRPHRAALAERPRGPSRRGLASAARCRLAVARKALTDARGSVFVEYVVVLTLVAVGVALATVACGVPLLEMYRAQVFWLGLPIQ